MTKKHNYPETNSNPDFAKISKKILSYWEEKSTFQRSVDFRPENNQFIFFDGPPFANGLPHYGHLLTGFVKDAIARFQTLKGKKVERRFGWDCHGLPAEMEAEKELGISGRKQIENYGIDKFNSVCRKSVLKYTAEWESYVTQQGRWVDFKNDYKTMDRNYMESVIWGFKELYKKGLVYESKRVMPYSWACQTPLSNFETKMDDAYRERADKAVTVKFKLLDKPKNCSVKAQNYYLLAWTTTPWTLPSNLALAVNKSIQYSCVTLTDDSCLIFATSALDKYKKILRLSDEETSYPRISGADLVDLKYEPIFSYFQGHKNAFRVLNGEFVEEGSGTGVVHMAPGFGEDDQILCAENNIDLVCPVDEAGKFTSEVPDFEGMQVFDANDPIIIKLKQQNNWIYTEQYLHNYPHCWRTDTPLIYKAVPSWYVKVTVIKDDLIKNNQKINWIPDHVRNGLFGKWLENVRDWSISRNRFWGTPIPIWQSDNPKYPRIDVYGSIAELEADFGVKLKDLHRPYIDELVRPNPDDPTGKSMMRRVTDVFDCWFESGSMPHAQVHYPFENKEKFNKQSSADFIVEYTAQTRGWFYTLMVLSTALFNQPAFLNCICHGVILDEKGQKLSKRLRNYADPKDIFAKYGSDSLRFMMCSSAVMRGQEFYIDKDGDMISDVVRLVLKPIWNSYNFFTLYANADGVEAKLISVANNFNDKYILSKLRDAIAKIDLHLSSYDLPSACEQVTNFFEVLNNWYIRRNRVRFWRTEKDQDKQEAYNTLYTVLYNMMIAASPLLPILTEEIFLGLSQDVGSVHLCDYPRADSFVTDEKLMSDIDKIREICTAALNIRNTKNIRVRQPLASLTVVGKNLEPLRKYFDLVMDEVNVKEVLIADDVEAYGKYSLKINFKEVGKRLAHRMKDIISEAKQESWQLVGGKIKIADEILERSEFDLTLISAEDKPGLALESGSALVILDAHITGHLELEGIARDFIRIVQQMRKTADLHVSDHVNIALLSDSEKITLAIREFSSYICEQTLADAVVYERDERSHRLEETHEILGHKITVLLSL